MVEGPEVQPIRVCLERNAQCFKGSIQLPGRKKPLRHYWHVGRIHFGKHVRPTQENSAGRLGQAFVWASSPTSTGSGNPRVGGLVCRRTRTRIMPSHRCSALDVIPSIVKGEKEQFLDWLSWGVESEAIRFPANRARFTGRAESEGHLLSQHGQLNS